MATQAETAQQLRDLLALSERDRVEVLAKFAALEAAIGAQADTTQEVTDALAALKGQLEARDADA